MTKLIVQYDDIDPTQIPRAANSPDYGVAGYVAGNWPDYSRLVQEFPKAKHKSIAIRADEDADILDVERGDANPRDAASWIWRMRSRGHKRPGVYADASTMPEVIRLLTEAGLKRDQYTVWVAHLHLKPPAYPFEQGADAVQWTFNALGRNLDESICNEESFWYIADPVKPKPKYHNSVPYKDFVLLPFHTKRWGWISERRVVRRYDELRPYPVRNEKELKVLEAKLDWLAKRVYNVTMRATPKGKRPNWRKFHRGVRFQQLIHRSKNWRFN